MVKNCQKCQKILKNDIMFFLIIKLKNYQICQNGQQNVKLVKQLSTLLNIFKMVKMVKKIVNIVKIVIKCKKLS